jgi:dipeptidase
MLDGSPNPNHYASNRLPLWIKPDHKLTVHEIMNFMRDHLEGTEFDMTKDIGAGPFGCPYRWRPLTYKVNGKTYLNERATATQQTGFTFVAQCRSWLPNPIGGLFWFSVDDASSDVYTPIYCGISKVPETYAVGNGSMIKWSDNSAFWTFNQVSNLAYTRYNVIHPEIEKLQQKLENEFIAYTPQIDQAAKKLYDKNKKLGISFITQYSVNTANELVYRWKKFYHYLFMKYKDGNIMKSKNYKLLDNGNGKDIPPMPDQPGYGEDWYKIIVEKTGDKFLYHGPDE